MQILVVAATVAESHFLSNREYGIKVLHTGVGLIKTAYSLTRELDQNNYDLCINIGIAGSYNRNIQLGEVVNVVSDFVQEEGAEDDGRFLSLYDLNLAKKDEFPFSDGILKSNLPFNNKCLSDLKKVSGLTRISSTGSQSSVDRFSKLNVDVETMEGAAFLYVCQMQKTPCLQIRAISNYVEKRNRESWKIDLALKNLEEFILKFLDELHVGK